MATAVTSLRIPTDLSERYNRLAKETGRSRSYYVNEALADSIDRFEYEYGILRESNGHSVAHSNENARPALSQAGGSFV